MSPRPRRRLNLPLSLILATMVACGLGGLAGLNHGEQALPAAGVDAPAQVDVATDERCVSMPLPTPRLRAGTRSVCPRERQGTAGKLAALR
jgi:hypothetical protein